MLVLNMQISPTSRRQLELFCKDRMNKLASVEPVTNTWNDGIGL